MSGRGWDTAVSVAAWEDIVRQYRAAGSESADDFELAEILRQKVLEVEG